MADSRFGRRLAAYAVSAAAGPRPSLPAANLAGAAVRGYPGIVDRVVLDAACAGPDRYLARDPRHPARIAPAERRSGKAVAALRLVPRLSNLRPDVRVCRDGVRLRLGLGRRSVP